MQSSALFDGGLPGKASHNSNVYVTIEIMEEVDVQEYLDSQDRSPFGRWFEKLAAPVAAKIVVAITRMQAGNLSNCKSLGGGLWENKLNVGPGYRIYFGKLGQQIIILLAGGTKKQQHKDIEIARQYWQNFKQTRGKKTWH